MGTSHISKPKAVALAFIAGWIAVQFIPVDRTNPPVTREVRAPPEVASVVRGACYDCHSNEVRWPWYGYLAPVSWALSRGVEEGRAAMNFSTWPDDDPAGRTRLIEAAVESVAQGRMPPRYYAVLHPGARLSKEDLAVLRGWVRPEP